MKVGAVLNLHPLSNATQRARYTWRTTRLTFQSSAASSWRPSSSFLSFCSISSVRKPPPCASTSFSSLEENESEKGSPFSSSSTSIEPNTPNPSNISKAISAAAGKNEKDIEFNLPWAVALAGAAFESYADVAVPGLVQKCPGGVEVTYTNQEFLRDKLAGLLKISVEDVCLRQSSLEVEVENGDTKHNSGHDQQKRKEDKESSSSFFCKLSIGDGYLELQPPPSSSNGDDGNFAKGGHSDSSGYLFVRNLERDRLSVRLINKKEESDAGGASLIASQFVEALKEKKSSSENRRDIEEKKVEISLDLQDKELKPIGFMRLKLEFKPFSDVFVASAASHGEPNLLGSPGPAMMTREWQDLTSQVLETSSAALEPVALIENRDTDTQVWIFINKSLRQLVVSFRGTVQDSWRNMLTDISMTPISLETKHMKEAPRHAALAKLSAEPGTVNKIMHTVAHAKKETELKKQAAKKAAENAAKFSEQEILKKVEKGAAAVAAEAADAIKSREEAEQEAEGLVSSAVGAVKTTATDIQEFLARLKYLIDNGAIEGLSPAPKTGHDDGGGGSGSKGDIWVHSGFLTAYDSVRGPVLGLIDTALANPSSISQENTASENAALQANDPSQKQQEQQQEEQEETSVAEESSNNDGNEGPWTVLFTGHSLGGALATLAAFDLSHRSAAWRSNKPAKIAMYNFGSPRVGNKAFATEFNRAVPHAWRLVNRNDAVVTVPRLVGYCHVGHAVIVGLDPRTHDKKIEVQLHSSEAPFEGVPVLDKVLPAVGTAITHAVTHAVPAVIKGVGMEIAAAAEDSEKNGNTKGKGNGNDTQDSEGKEKATATLTSEQLAEYWEQEKEAWSALFYGSAISEHMEEYYFQGIEDAVDEWRQQRVASSQSRNSVSGEYEDNKENEQQNNENGAKKGKNKNKKFGVGVD